MATKIDVSALTLNAEEVTQVSEAIVEQVFIQGELSQIHDVQTGIQHQKQIVFVNNLDVSGEALTGCVPAEQGGLTLTEKFWTPALIAGRYTHCAADLNQLLKIYQKAQRANPDFFDRISSQELGMLTAKVIEALKVSVSAKAWLGDTAAAVQPGGNFTIVGFNAGLWNQFEGLFKQIFADATIPRYTIAENAGATYALQALAANKAQTIFQEMYEAADSRLLGSPDAQILVTRSIWDNYLKTTETTQGNGGILTRQEDGVISLNYRGIPVIKMNEWDRTIRKYQDDLTVHFRPHRAVMTTPSNIPLGTLSESDLNSLESFYDQTLKSNIVDFAYFLDAKFGESYMASVAY
jgi:hypothetical protein